MAKKNGEIFYNCTQETLDLIEETRRIDKSLSNMGNVSDTLTAKLSEVAGAVSAIAGLKAVNKGMQACAVAERHFEGYEVRDPAKREEFKIPVFDFQAAIDRNEEVRRARDRRETIETARQSEFARLKARDEWEASKQATASLLAAVAATPAPVGAGEVDLTTVVTRNELIAAFGKFTGMNMTWFDNLKDTPRLKAARKYTGQGGRHSAEPLFCPYEVMQWLADPKRKKGKELSQSTAWRLLKSHFPKVHNQYSIGDPNAD